MSVPVSSRPRVSVDGKFFRLGEKKFFVKGVAYGPFAPNDRGDSFASPEQTARDFAQVRELGANLLRVYHVPPRWFLDLAAGNDLKLLIDIPWGKQLCFLDSEPSRQQARAAIRQAALACAGHPEVLALCLVNEIPPDVVRWCGARAVADFIDELVDAARAIDPDCLCTFANFPPTEFLHPQNFDFHTFNVYLHQQRPFENYLYRLQTQAGARPLLLGEFGLDSLREGEERKCETLSWQIESAFRCGLAGTIVYSFTDDWSRDGRQVEDWGLGLTTRDRKPKRSFKVVQKMFRAAPHFPLHEYPKVSVVVASYNGGRTLKACLDSLEQLNYPDCEVLLVDDGSTDATPQIASLYQNVRYLRQTNQGLSAARNTGIQAAAGDIVAFTDSDCRADRDWLHYLVGDLLNSEFAGIGGHNFLPPDDSSVAAAVMVSPGGPAHVMLTDRLAEHIPGCNMAFYKWALTGIGGFDPVFRTAGDDVDVCWRLQQRGYRLGFSHAGFVWHYRRPTPGAYFKQQRGYGEAEALLVRKHPEYFNALGGSLWRGRIYTAAKFGVELRRPMIYHGFFASGFFQFIYKAPPNMALMWLTSLEYHVLVTLPLLVVGVVFWNMAPNLAPLPGVAFRFPLPLAFISLLVSVSLCVAAAVQADLPKKKRRFWSRPLVALLFCLQPLVRGWARYHGSLRHHSLPAGAGKTLARLKANGTEPARGEAQYWASGWFDRLVFLRRVLERLDHEGWQNKCDTGWCDFDVEISGSRWGRLQLSTVAESHAHGTLIRCRLRTGWSLLAKLTFWSALGFELLVLGFVGQSLPAWIWLLPVSVLIFAAFLQNEECNLRRLIGAFLDGVARELHLTRVDAALQKKQAAHETLGSGRALD